MILFDQFKQVRAFVFAIDGVCTDGGVWVGDGGERYCRIHSRDYYALQVAVVHGYPIAVIGGRQEVGIRKVMEEVGINDVFLNQGDKSTVLHDWMTVRRVEAEQVLYMGSDIPDLRGMEIARIGACPVDAAEDVKAAAAYVSPFNGGAGAMRDVIEKVMKLHGAWELKSAIKVRSI